jgi:hypothetical protein
MATSVASNSAPHRKPIMVPVSFLQSRISDLGVTKTRNRAAGKATSTPGEKMPIATGVSYNIEAAPVDVHRIGGGNHQSARQ